MCLRLRSMYRSTGAACCACSLGHEALPRLQITALVQVPPNCGQLGAKCCPGVSNASAPEQPPVPFCNGADVYGSAPQGSVNYSVCEKLPKSPEKCGGAGVCRGQAAGSRCNPA